MITVPAYSSRLGYMGIGLEGQARMQMAWDDVNFAIRSGFCQDMVDSAIGRMRRLMQRYGVDEVVPQV